MSDFSSEQKAILLQAARDYLEAVVCSGKSRVEIHARYDQQRDELIKEDLRPLLDNYFQGSVELSEFKKQVDGKQKPIQIPCIKNRLFGFRGFSGQVFFNMLVKSAKSAEECNSELKSALSLPANDEEAATQLRNFYDYVVRVRDIQNSRLQPSRVPFFVSYFWQIREPTIWPIYFPNSVQAIRNMKFRYEIGEVGQDYLSFKRFHEGIIDLVSKKLGRHFTLYDVEHVLWLKRGNDVNK